MCICFLVKVCVILPTKWVNFIFLINLQGTALFSGKIYTAGKKFTRPLVATVVTNFKSVQVLSHWSNFNMYKASRQCAPSCEFAMHQRKCNCNVCSCVAFLLYASSSCAFLEYLITWLLMLRYARTADNWLDFPQCVSKWTFFRAAPWLAEQSHKNPVSASAMLTGKFLQIRKVFATSSLLAEEFLDTLQYKISRKYAKCPNELESFWTI